MENKNVSRSVMLQNAADKGISVMSYKCHEWII